MTASPQALAAVRAAKNYRRWGRFACLRFVEKSRISPRLFLAALDFEGRRKS